MEACGSSHHWARQLRDLGHDVRLIATKFVKPFVKGNKDDAADARVIWEAAQRPEMRFVSEKSQAQQAILALHSMRDGLVKARTAQLHQLRAAFYEMGIELPEGRHWCVKRLPDAFAWLESQIPATVIEALRDQYPLVVQPTERVDAIECKLEVYMQSDERCRRLLEIPGVGLLAATSIVASVGDAREFRSGREFAAWLGVVPRHSGTGGHVRILNISKRGNGYLRAMVIHCARAVMARQKEHSSWLQRLMISGGWRGVQAEVFSEGLVRVSLTRSTIEGVSDAALQSENAGSGTTKVVVGNSLIAANGVAWSQLGAGSAVLSLGNNQIWGNGAPVGVLTPLAPQ
jgi:transposase